MFTHFTLTWDSSFQWTLWKRRQQSFFVAGKWFYDLLVIIFLVMRKFQQILPFNQQSLQAAT